MRTLLLILIAATCFFKPCRGNDHVDTLLQEMLYFIQPDIRLTKAERQNIEKKIRGFSQKIQHRDTTTLFLHTAYAEAYYEFSSHDYKKAMQWVNNFRQRIDNPKMLFDLFVNFPALFLYG
ncbi:MAG: hypothetical protein K2F87_01235 [Muribaculaceae bacterium]|nr:hypothetical protein [Muribaculaceae bacterium]